MRIANELRVGIMFLAGVALLLIMVATLTNWWPGRKGYDITIRFDQAQGIREGAEVRVAGIKVGFIKAISLNPVDNSAQLLVRIENEDLRLFDKYLYAIGIGGLVGERYIEITPVSGPDKGKLVFENGNVKGTSSGDINALIDNASIIVSKLVITADSLQSLIGNKQLHDNIIQASADIQNTTALTTVMLSQLNQMIGRNVSAVDLIVADMRATAGDIRQMSNALVTQTSGSKLFANLDETSYNAVLITRHLAAISQTMDTMISDPQLAAGLRESLSSLQQSSLLLQETISQARLASTSLPPVMENMQAISESMKVVGTNLQAASGDIPKITAPLAAIAPETAENLRVISSQFRETSERVNGIAEKISALTGTFSNTGSSAGTFKFEPEARVTEIFGANNRARSDLNMNLYAGKSMFRIGLADIGNNGGVNAQLAKSVGTDNNFWFRYGIVQSRLGGGFDYQPHEDIKLSAELFDPAKIRGNLLLDYRLRGLSDNMWLTGGIYDLFQKNSVGVGMTYR